VTATAGGRDSAPPLIAHLVYRFDVGGLENGVVNLINHPRMACYRHAVIALTDVTDFRQRVRAPDVQFHALEKPPGHGFKIYGKLYRLLRSLRPAIVHTRNLAALEAVVPAALARVPVRIHGEHGRDISDLAGESLRYQRVRRLFSPFVHRYVALSRDLQSYLTDRVGIAAGRVEQIYNGVDLGRFLGAGPGDDTYADAGPADWPWTDPDLFVIGSVGRMEEVKNQELLARAFVRLAQHLGPAQPCRLVLVGDGSCKARVQAVLREAGLEHAAWLPGNRHDVPALMRRMDLFVLPSLAEGISNTILEAMACGLPVVATAVGGNPELVRDGATGALVPSGDTAALADALARYAGQRELARRHGQEGRRLAENRFSLDAMAAAYAQLYDRLLQQRTDYRPAMRGT
jgi:sugar transferase (PEP-CTERM/EpsH1 system associated)